MFSTSPETQERCHFFFSFSLPFLKLKDINVGKNENNTQTKRVFKESASDDLHACVLHFVHCNEPFSFRNRSNQQLGNGQLLIKIYTPNAKMAAKLIFFCLCANQTN